MDKIVEKVSGTNLKVEATYSPEEWQEKMDAMYKKIGKSVQLKGFRKGKAPLNVLKMYIPVEYVEEEIRKDELDAIVKQLMEEGYKIVGVLSADWKDEDGKKIVSMVIETYPEISFDDVDLSSIDIEPLEKATEVSDEEVEKAIRESLEPYFAIEKSADKEELEEGDIAFVEWKMIVGGKETPARETTFVVGEGDFIEEVEPHLVGMKRDEKRYILVNSETNEAKIIDSPEEAEGDDVYVVEVTLKDIRTKELELTDEVAKKVGYDSVDALRDAVKESIRRQKWEQWRDEALQKVSELVKLEVPQTMIIDEVNARYKGLRKEASKAGMEWEEYVARLGFEDEEQLIEKLKEIAEQTLRLYLVLLSLAKYFGIDTNDEQMEEKVIEKLAEVVSKKEGDSEQVGGEE
ncbi:MAG: trigger factor [Dictyoglomi bacterium]|jgi:trigger factor|nr:trigger factor [Dictyoglomota bacterium]